MASTDTLNAGLWGNSKAKQKRKKMSGTKGNNNGRPASLRTYCPVCPDIPARPETQSHVTCNSKTRFAKARCGHAWVVGGDSYLGQRPMV